MRITSSFVVLIVATTFLTACANGKNRIGHAQWQPLIENEQLDGWVQRGGPAKYSVEGEQIVGRSVVAANNSFLCTKREYADFVLEYDFKVDPLLNSGVQIRSNSALGYQNGRVHGYQVEIDPSERAWTAGIYDEGRRGWLADLKDNEPARQAFRPKEWNHVRVEAIGDSIKTFLNGVPVADLIDNLTYSGFIALQVHATRETKPLEVRWRNLRIKDLGNPHRTPPKNAVVLLGPDGNTSQWQHAGKPDAPVEWIRVDGALQVKPGAGSLVTKRTFGDCQLHVEFMVDDNGKEGQGNGNSGVYLQSRYEVQILNSAGAEPADNLCGGIYKVKAPDFNMARPAYEWQRYDITFRAPRWDDNGKKVSNARIAVYHNGTRIHDNVEIPDSTGSGMPEGPTDGPLLLQDHGNLVRFHNVWIVPLREE